MDKETSEKKPLSQKPEPIKKASVNKGASAKITFRQNRKFDLHVSRNMITFRGRETKTVPKEWLDHRDFKQVERYFILEGV